MIAKLIRWSIANRFLVLLATLAFAAWGTWAVLRTPLDAIPDLSDVQVIIRTTYPGQAPQIVENQITYPLTTTMLSVPGAKTVRGYSFFGDSFVYVLFEDGTDPYWARSRVLEYLNQVQSRLPPQAKTALGPDATGVGWVYEYALVDRSGRMDLSQLRALQDWFLKYELKAVTNVSEVASVGGMVRQYQIVLDPVRLRAFNIPQAKVIAAVQRANQETGGSVLELGEAEYMVRASGYLQSLDDFRKIPLSVSDSGIPVRLADVARVQVGPEMRRGLADHAPAFLARERCGRVSVMPGLDPLVRVLYHHHRGVHHRADRDGDAAQRHDVGVHALEIHDNERGQDSERQRNDGDERRTQMEKEEHAHQRHDDELLDEFLSEVRHGPLDERGAVVGRHDLHP